LRRSVAVVATTDKRVLVIGAQGVLGGLVAKAFQDAGWSVRRGGRRPAPDGTLVDLDQPDTVERALSPEELVINTVPHPGLVAERKVLDQGGMLINISALPAAAGRALRAVAGDARGTVIMNAGIAPGVTNLVAADLLAAHPEADEVQMVFTLSTTNPRGRASADFAHRGITAVARHRTAVIPLPVPFGERRCLGFGEDDAGWLGGLAEGRIVRTYVCIAEQWAHRSLLALNRTGAMTKLPRAAFGPRPPAASSEASREPVAHWVAVLRKGRCVGACTIECDGDFVHAARATVALAEQGRHPGRAPGCFDPEEIVTLKDVESTLRASGILVVSRSGHGAVAA
jgi:NAD(P)-dependent dehydrogenase (short-subunit alcohol dehydrogenase family)